MHLSRIGGGLVLMAFAGWFGGCTSMSESADSSYRYAAGDPSLEVPPQSEPKTPPEEDPGAFTTPWTAIERYTRQEGIARRTNVANVAMLASAGEGPLLEAICAENPFSLMGLETIPIAQSKQPDF